MKLFLPPYASCAIPSIHFKNEGDVAVVAFSEAIKQNNTIHTLK
jgi:hypothetical protein